MWPWIAQIGTRGGFYSFTFIEDRRRPLGDSYAVDYTNANIIAEWQNPQPGESMISGILKVASQPGNGCWSIPSSRRSL